MNNLAESDEFVQISASGFLTLILHVFRFWSSDPTGEKKSVYGLLIGYIENNSRIVRKVIPITHIDKSDLDMDDNFMKQIGRINRMEMENGSTNEVIGWYRSSLRGIKFTARDIKNHINFQDFHPKFISLILDPQIYLDPDQSGFSVFRLKGDKYYNMMSDYYRIPWEIEEIENSLEIINDFKKYIRHYFIDKPLITELNET